LFFNHAINQVGGRMFAVSKMLYRKVFMQHSVIVPA
jgi:hypothetical protein